MAPPSTLAGRAVIGGTVSASPECPAGSGYLHDTLEVRMLGALRAEGRRGRESRAFIGARGEVLVERARLRDISMASRWLHDALLPPSTEPESDEPHRAGLLRKEIPR